MTFELIHMQVPINGLATVLPAWGSDVPQKPSLTLAAHVTEVTIHFSVMLNVQMYRYNPRKTMNMQMYRYNPRLVFRTPVPRRQECGGTLSKSARLWTHAHWEAAGSAQQGQGRFPARSETGAESEGWVGRHLAELEGKSVPGSHGPGTAPQGEGAAGRGKERVHSTTSPRQRRAPGLEGHSDRGKVLNAHLPHSAMTRGLPTLPFFTFSVRYLHSISLPYMHMFC